MDHLKLRPHPPVAPPPPRSVGGGLGLTGPPHFTSTVTYHVAASVFLCGWWERRRRGRRGRRRALITQALHAVGGSIVVFLTGLLSWTKVPVPLVYICVGHQLLSVRAPPLRPRLALYIFSLICHTLKDRLVCRELIGLPPSWFGSAPCSPSGVFCIMSVACLINLSVALTPSCSLFSLGGAPSLGGVGTIVGGDTIVEGDTVVGGPPSLGRWGHHHW